MGDVIFYDLFTMASEDIAKYYSQIEISLAITATFLAPSTLCDMENVSHSFFGSEKRKSVKNNLRLKFS